MTDFDDVIRVSSTFGFSLKQFLEITNILDRNSYLNPRDVSDGEPFFALALFDIMLGERELIKASLVKALIDENKAHYLLKCTHYGLTVFIDSKGVYSLEANLINNQNPSLKYKIDRLTIDLAGSEELDVRSLNNSFLGFTFPSDGKYDEDYDQFHTLATQLFDLLEDGEVDESSIEIGEAGEHIAIEWKSCRYI